jgi:hypothetical protein
MLDTDIRRLVDRDTPPSIDRLERDIWDGVAARAQADRIFAVVLGCQAAVLAVALVGGITAGSYAATASSAPGLGVFSTRAPLVPSTLLLSDDT